MPDIIIIGAGIAGLFAAAKLSAAGKKVLLLEARDRMGGRIHTLKDRNFSTPVAAGAEFVHGEAPVTRHLMEKAGLVYVPVSGPMLRLEDGILNRMDELEIPFYEELVAKLQAMEEDITVAEFIQRHFSDDKYEALRQSVLGLVAGYEAADPVKASMLAMKGDFTEEDMDGRIQGGYEGLLQYLLHSCRQQGCDIQLSCPVVTIMWKNHDVVLTTANGDTYTAPRVLITLPLGVLKEGTLHITPALPGKEEAIQQLGNGKVMKILLEFKSAFWKDVDAPPGIKAAIQDFSFLLSDAPIPTWWPGGHMLTGWLGGNAAAALELQADDAIIDQALASLSAIFGVDREHLQQQLQAAHIPRWHSDPYSRGAYSYAVVNEDKYVAALATPVADTLFFAGETVYTGPAKGTVEAALVSAANAAKLILQSGS